MFSQPVVAATFFYVHGFGYGGTGDLATAYAADGSVVASLSSKAVTTSGDLANFVTLTGSKPITRITFVGGVVDNFSFSVVNNTANSAVLAAGQVSSNLNFGVQYVPTALEVQSVTPTSTGFKAVFNAPVNTSVLNLYDASGVYGRGRHAGRAEHGAGHWFTRGQPKRRDRHLHQDGRASFAGYVYVNSR